MLGSRGSGASSARAIEQDTCAAATTATANTAPASLYLAMRFLIDASCGAQNGPWWALQPELRGRYPLHAKSPPRAVLAAPGGRGSGQLGATGGQQAARPGAHGRPR